MNLRRTMKFCLLRFGLVKTTTIFCLLFSAPSMAQVIPDQTLPTNSKVTPSGNANVVTEGTTAGSNLFHSFEEFSVPEGIEAVFENAPDIENIFTRITGESASSIDGILRTQGEANFFLVNPNGIVFGENAQLDIGGSFVATTADNIQFEDGTEFAANTDEEPILTISVPIGLQFEDNSGAITVNGKGNQINSESPVAPLEFDRRPTGLSVPSDKTFALVGNGVSLNGGVINTTANGKIFLSSLSSGSVNINQTENGFTLTSPNTTEYQDISLDRQSLIDASGERTGTVSLTGKNINILDESFILSQNQGSLPSGSLNIQASESLTVSGRSAKSDVRSNIRSESLNNGKGADINISTNNIYFQDGARIRSNSFSQGLGGDITINASDSIQLSAPSSIIATTFAEGNGGDVSLSASKLQVDASGLSSSTNGSGNGGSLDVNADLIEIVGTSATDRASISTTTFSDGDANNLTLNTKKLRIIDGASLSSSSFANGNAGDITVNASESVEVEGKSNSSISTNNPQSTIRAAVQTVPPPARKALGLPDMPSGDGGNVTITTPVFNIIREGVVTVENQGTGTGGMLNISAEQLNLSEAGKITAATESGTGGTVNLNTENLQIGEDSTITATAENNGDGGNINIKAISLFAKKNSEITANAFGGRGGNINIDAEGLFLFDSPENIFSASSELGIDGEIQIDTPDINLQKELEQSELEIFTAEQAIANSCLARSDQQGSFTINNNGGLPKNPNSNYSDASFSLTGVSRLTTTTKQPSEILENTRQQNSSAIPAQKMIETRSGRIFLVAAPQKAESFYCHSVEEPKK